MSIMSKDEFMRRYREKNGGEVATDTSENAKTAMKSVDPVKLTEAYRAGVQNAIESQEGFGEVQGAMKHLDRVSRGGTAPITKAVSKREDLSDAERAALKVKQAEENERFRTEHPELVNDDLADTDTGKILTRLLALDEDEASDIPGAVSDIAEAALSGKSGYVANPLLNFATGIMDTANMVPEIRNMAQDIKTGGEYTREASVISDFMNQNPVYQEKYLRGEITKERLLSLINHSGAEVSRENLNWWLAANSSSMRDALVYERTDGVADGYKQIVGGGAKSIGRMVIPLMAGNAIGAIGNAVSGSSVTAGSTSAAGSSGGLIGSIITRKSLGEILRNTLTPSASKVIMSIGAGTSAFNENANAGAGVGANAVYSTLSSFSEYLAEGLFGLPSAEAFGSAGNTAVRNIIGSLTDGKVTGNTVKVLLKNLAQYAINAGEEGLEEGVTNVLNGLASKITVSPDKKWFGDGGVFDFKQIGMDVASGAFVGAVMGSVGVITSSVAQCLESGDVRGAAEAMNAWANTHLNDLYRPAELDPGTATVETVKAHHEALLEAYVRQVTEADRAEAEAEVIEHLNEMAAESSLEENTAESPAEDPADPAVESPEEVAETATEKGQADGSPAPEIAAERGHGAQEGGSAAEAVEHAQTEEVSEPVGSGAEVIGPGRASTLDRLCSVIRELGKAGLSFDEAFHRLREDGILDANGRMSDEAVERLREAWQEGHDSVKNTRKSSEKAESEAVTTTDGAYTITERGGQVEVSFGDKPSAAVRNALKELGFRWHGKRKVWYGKAERSDVEKALRETYRKETAYTVYASSPYDTHEGAADDLVEYAKGKNLLGKADESLKNEKTVTTNMKDRSDNTEDHSANVENRSENTEADSPSMQVASYFLDRFRAGVYPNKAKLDEKCAKAFGGTLAEGVYTPKDAYDALELAVNLYLKELARDFNTDDPAGAVQALAKLENLVGNLPTQTNRTAEQEKFQQFSTPPTIAYLAAWAANIEDSDVVLEPSAGIGGLALYPKAWGATVAVNELDERRRGVLSHMGFDLMTGEDARYVQDVPALAGVSPSVVLMNPPFSSQATTGMATNTGVSFEHVEAALEKLTDGGRLVTVLGAGRDGVDTKQFTAWIRKLKKDYTVRANVVIDGKNYRKYGTDFNVRIVVIDKVGAHTGETVTGTFTNLNELPEKLKGVRDARESGRAGFESDRGLAGDTGGVRADPRVSGGERAVGDTHAGAGVPVAGGSVGAHDGAPVGGGESAARGAVSGSHDAAVGRGTPGRGERDPGGSDREVGRAQSRGAGRSEKSDADRVHEGKGVPATDHAESGGGDAGQLRGVDQRRGDARSETVTAPASESATAPAKDYKAGTPKKKVKDTGVYSDYVAPALPVKGLKAHPAVLVESSAMASVQAPKATYKPHLSRDAIDRGVWSGEQMVNIVYAGQAHAQTLPNGTRKGYLIGDGTGVGKGRQIAGIIMDNLAQGRKRAVWISNNAPLFEDAVRDWTAVGGDKADVMLYERSKVDKRVGNDGILFTTYSTLGAKPNKNSKDKTTNLDKIVAWLGEDFDGVIAFDEAHNMANAIPKKGGWGQQKPAAKALAGLELQRRLPKARIVYVSATAATSVGELAYAERLGLWGEGTAFRDRETFLDKMTQGGTASMELVARDMKAMGVYNARFISYDGVQYDTLRHKLTRQQREMYDTLSDAWQTVIINVENAMAVTGANKDGKARGRYLSGLYGSQQRFYQQILCALSMPSVIEDIQRELDAGHSCVLQIVNTNEAQESRTKAAAKETDADLEELDFSPRNILIDYLMNAFPITRYEEYKDEDGNVHAREVKDADGNPVISQKAVAMRDDLISQIEALSIPDNPLDMLYRAFGVDNVAEITGRSSRVVPLPDENGEMRLVDQKRGKAAVSADVEAFQNGDKRILVFSDAGGTGKSYHADRAAKNQQKRIHYLIQPGWNAVKAVQGFGRTHRSNQVSAPTYKLVTTDISGQARFISTIAKRLDNLGAMTKGQRQAGSGFFSAADNLESDLAAQTLFTFYKMLDRGAYSEFSGREIIRKLGLERKLYTKEGYLNVESSEMMDVSLFLNRVLSLRFDEQNALFGHFVDLLTRFTEDAEAKGELDKGMENVRADRAELVDEKVIREYENGGEPTKFLRIKTYTKARIEPSVKRIEKMGNDFLGIYRDTKGQARAIFALADKTEMSGAVTKRYRVQSPNLGRYGVIDGAVIKKYTRVPTDEMQVAWDEAVASMPEYDVRDTYMVTGALLPIWDRLSDDNIKVQRITLDSGERYLGRVINQTQADQLLRQFGQSRKVEKLTGEQIVNAIIGEGRVFRVDKGYYDYKLERARVSGEYRIEATGSQRADSSYDMDGVIVEKIGFDYRYFIPVGEKGAAMLDGLIRNGARVSVKEESGTEGVRARRKPALREAKALALSERVNPYTNEEAESIKRDGKNRIATTYTDIYEFLYNALDENGAGRLFVGKLKSDVAAKIMSETNVSAYGKSIVLTMDDLRHLFKQHGNPETEAQRGQEAITDENFGDVLTAVLEPDHVTKSEDGSGVISLVFQKENNGTTTAVTVVSEKKKALTLKSAWRTKKGQHISPPSDVQAPNQTPNSELSMNADPTVSIAQTAGSVKRKVEKTNSEADKHRSAVSDSGEGAKAFSREDHAGPVTRSELAQFIKERFGVQITFGHVTQKEDAGQYNPKTGGMRVRKSGDIETVAHELGHHLAREFGLSKELFGSFGDQLRGLVPADVKDSYEQSELPEEGFAEFLTRYLMNRGHAELQFGRDAEGKVSEESLFYRFESALDKRTLADLKEAAIAAEAMTEGKNYAEMYIIARDRPYHGHFLLDVAKAYRERVEPGGKEKFRSATEAILDTAAVHVSEGDLKSRYDAELLFRDCWVDEAALIEDICRHAGDGNADAYIHAINAAYSTSRAERILMGDKLTDMEGRIVGEGLSPILEPLYDKTKQVEILRTGKTVTVRGRFLNLERYDRIGEYLLLKHAPERMAEGMTVHVDERITPEYCEARCAEIEAEFPEFADMAARLYAYQTNVLKAWAVQTGIVSAEAAEEWAKRWAFYVPFKRDMTDRMNPGSNRFRDTFANQKNPFRRAVGSTRDIIHPIHSIMQTTVQLVMISNKNRVCLALTEALKGYENSALLMEKIPLHHGRDHVNTEKAKEGVLNDLMTVAAEKVGAGKQTAEEAASGVTEIMEIIDSYFENEMNRFYVERTPRSAQEITVLRNGEVELWRVNNPALFRELAGMSKEAMGRTVRLWSKVVRFQTSALTGANLLWSLRSNVARDFQSAMVFLQKNGKGIKGIAGAFRDLVKGYIASFQYLSAERMGRAPKVWKDGFNADFEEFLAMGAAGGSVWAGDKALSRNALKRMGNKAWSDKFNILGWINTLSMAVEQGPRYAEYHLSKQLGATSAVAFYHAMDLTTNFSKGGRLAREINKFIPFFNATIQGLNRLVRYYTAADVGVDGKFVHGEARKKLIVQRVTGLVMASVIGAALTQLLRFSDKEDYDRLSNYTKLNYWCIPVPFDCLGLSKHEFITIPKPRELAVLESTLSFFAEHFLGKDWADGELEDWWEYVAGTVAPPIVGDLLQIPSDGIEESGFNILGSIGVVGPLIEVFANRNFLGQPIVPTYLEDVLPEDQYKQDTSLVAYWLGQAFGLSPTKLDHLAEGFLGGYWEWHKSLFPKGGWDYADLSLGFRSNLIRNSAYSTDVANRLYDGREAAMLASNSDPEDLEKKITYKWYDAAASFYSRYGKLAKATEDGEQAEDDRLRALEHVESFLSVMESGGKVAGQDELEAYVRATGDTSVMPAVMQTFIKYGEDGAFDEELSLDAREYIEFQGKYNELYWKYADKALAGNLTEEQRGEALQVARDQALIEAKNYILALHGYSSKRYKQTTGYDDVKSAGVSLTDYAKVKLFWREAESDKDRNGQTVSGSKRDKVAEYIDSLRLSDKKKDALYLAMGYSESTLKDAPWH